MAQQFRTLTAEGASELKVESNPRTGWIALLAGGCFCGFGLGVGGFVLFF